MLAKCGAPYHPAMAIRNISELKSLIKPGDRVLGLDVGSKTIGIAIADGSLTVATPLETIRRSKFTSTKSHT